MQMKKYRCRYNSPIQQSNIQNHIHFTKTQQNLLYTIIFVVCKHILDRTYFNHIFKYFFFSFVKGESTAKEILLSLGDPAYDYHVDIVVTVYDYFNDLVTYNMSTKVTY